MTESRLPAVLILTGLALAAAAGLALLRDATAERIRLNESRHLLEQLAAVLPPADQYDNAPQLDITMVHSDMLGDPGGLPVYRARLDGEPVAAVLTVIAPAGYVDQIRLLVGIDLNGRIIGARAVQHSETPGLGDGIDTSRSDWILAFDGRSLDNLPVARWSLRRDGGEYDQLTGATITSRAVIKALRQALEFYAGRQVQLFVPVEPPDTTDALNSRP